MRNSATTTYAHSVRRWSRLCAFCADHPACDLSDLDGKRFPICARCRFDWPREPEHPDGEPLRDRALAALERFDGAVDIGELAAALGVDDDLGRARLSASLKRAIADGQVTFIGGRMSRLYRISAEAVEALRSERERKRRRARRLSARRAANDARENSSSTAAARRALASPT